MGAYLLLCMRESHFVVSPNKITCGAGLPNDMPSESITLSLAHFAVPPNIANGAKFIVNFSQKVDAPISRYLTFADLHPDIESELCHYEFRMIQTSQNCIKENTVVKEGVALAQENLALVEDFSMPLICLTA